MNKTIVIVADYREKTWDDYVRKDLLTIPYSKDMRLKLELRLDDKFMDILDLINYSINRHDNKLADGFASMDNYVTLNGIFLADYLRKREFKVHLIRNFVSQKEHVKRILLQQPLAVIVSSTFMNFSRLKEVVKFIKTHRVNKTEIVIGGATIFEAKEYNPSIFNDLKKVCKDTFFILDRQGQKSLLKLLNDLASEKFDVSNSCNIMLINNMGKFQLSPIKPENNSLNDHIIDWGSMPEEFLESVIPIRTSHGCPFQCAFCTFWMMNPTISCKSITNIKDELNGIKKRKIIKHMMFTDELINVTKERAKAVCQTIIDADLPASWSSFLRVRPVDKEIVDLLKRSNCKFVYIGFESFDDRILRNMNKTITFKDQIRCIKLLKKAGIGIIGSFIFGYPGETRKTLRRTIKLINDTGIDFAETFPFFYFPHSPVSKRRKAFKLEGSFDDWSHYSMTYKELSEMLPSELVRLGTSFGHFDWDVWATVAILASKGLGISDIKEIFAIRRELMKIQNRGKAVSESILEKRTNRINDIIMRVNGG